MVVDQGHREGDSVVITHQRKQHPCVSGGADPSHDLYFPGGFGPDVWGCTCCDEGGASRGHTNEGKVGVSREHPQQLPTLPWRCGGSWEAKQELDAELLRIHHSLFEPTDHSWEVTGQLDSSSAHSQKALGPPEDDCCLPGHASALISQIPLRVTIRPQTCWDSRCRRAMWAMDIHLPWALSLPLLQDSALSTEPVGSFTALNPQEALQGWKYFEEFKMQCK